MKKMCFLWFFMGFVTITSAQDIAPGQQAQGYLEISSSKSSKIRSEGESLYELIPLQGTPVYLGRRRFLPACEFGLYGQGGKDGRQTRINRL